MPKEKIEEKEGEQKEEPKLNAVEIRILEYLKSVPTDTQSSIAFHIQANFNYTGKYLKHLEELGYVEIDKDLIPHFPNRSYWKLKQEKLEDDPNKKR